jgi:hypothetical protein
MTFGPALVRRGSTERVAPILMTALVAGMALVPLLWRGNVPGEEIEYPMAIVIIGGLFSATILNLFVVPDRSGAAGYGVGAAAATEPRAGCGPRRRRLMAAPRRDLGSVARPAALRAL